MKRFFAFLIITFVLGGVGFFVISFLKRGSLSAEKGFGEVGAMMSAPPPPNAQPAQPAGPGSSDKGAVPMEAAPSPQPSPQPKPTARISSATPKSPPFETKPPQPADAFKEANIAFQTPNRMQMGRSRDVELLFSLQKSIEELTSELGNEFPVDGATVASAPIMEATLSGGAFDITPPGPQRQAVRPNETTSWEWSVIPREQGQHTLKLRLFALVNIQGMAAPMEIKTFEREIPVEVSIAHMVGEFAVEHLELVWIALVLPIAGFLTRFIGRKA